MVSFNSATSNFRRGGLTTRSGSSTVDLLNGEAPPTTTNQKPSWYSQAMDWVGNHSEGFGKVLSGIGEVGVRVGDAIIKKKGGQPFLKEGYDTVKKEVGKYADKYEKSGFGKFLKGFALKDSAKEQKEDKEEKEVKKEVSNGHVPTGYDRTKPYYISPSVGGRNYNQLSQAVANEWKRYNQQGMNPFELTDKQKRKAWKKWLKKKRGKKGKKDKKASGGNPPKSKGGNPK